MVKKSKAKKGGDAAGKGADEAKEKISEVDKEWFQIQIKSLEDRLQRRNEKLHNLSQEISEYKERYEQLREDKADVVAFLKRTLQQRTDQISELQARLEGLQHLHTTETENYETKLAQMRKESAKTKEQLASENMVLAKKLDALEEFRIQREQLLSKFNEQEKQTDDMKRSYETKLENLEKKHIQEEDRLKKEMMSKLESVASEFRQASHAQMAATTQRTIRENVNVSSQVSVLSNKVSTLMKDNETLAKCDRDNRRKIGDLEAELKKLIERNAFRLKVIEELSSRCSDQEKQLQNLCSVSAERRQYEAMIDKLNGELRELQRNLGSKEDSTKEKDNVISEIKVRLAGISRTRDIINSCLNEASGSIKSALCLQEAAETDDAEIQTRREDILNQLLLMLNTAVSESRKAQESALAPKPDREDDDIDYLHGSLGLVPLT